MIGPDAIVLFGAALIFGGLTIVARWLPAAIDLTLSALSVVTTAASSLYPKEPQS